ncbi:hypothetical protein E2C01_092592 [Portunus trituberculatus]|uniref:Uncharacterized protein n=1 Tax=Portunus trituberculatus TaxID=210409 RepID=A0A5B7JVV1_PORTR|nr:hypothetical protein [Portunus trituberculatus]
MHRQVAHSARGNRGGETIKIYYRGHMSTDYKTEEKTIKNIVYKNVRPTDKNSRITLTIYSRAPLSARSINVNRN